MELCGEGGLDRLPSAIFRRREQVGVDAQGEARVGVAEVLGDRLH